MSEQGWGAPDHRDGYVPDQPTQVYGHGYVPDQPTQVYGHGHVPDRPTQVHGYGYGPEQPAQVYGAGYPQGYGPPPRRNGNRGVLAVLVTAVLAGAVVLTLFLTGVFDSEGSGHGGAGDTPERAARATFDALKAKDIPALKGTLCAEDTADTSPILPVLARETVASFQIGSTTTVDETHAQVQVTSSTADDPDPDSDKLPMVKENGSWKSCFSALLPH